MIDIKLLIRHILNTFVIISQILIKKAFKGLVMRIHFSELI